MIKVKCLCGATVSNAEHARREHEKSGAHKQALQHQQQCAKIETDRTQEEHFRDPIHIPNSLHPPAMVSFWQHLKPKDIEWSSLIISRL